jgi:signal transduction histidine kinase
MDLQQVISQNEILHATNQEISKFQRQLIRDKATIEDKSRKLHELNELLEESNKTKDTLLSIIAHDLKNPFSTIIGLSKLLAKNWSVYNPIKVKNFADNIYAVSVQSHNLLDNLLNWARMQTGNFSAQVSRNDTLTMVGGVVISLQEMALSKGIKLETELQEAQFVVADKNMITTVLRNLITNAIKFSFANSTIRIGSKREGENQVFWVADTGMGIDPAELETILEKKMNKSRLGTSNERGTGIGLPLCMDFIKKNGGTFYATSMLGQGSTFYFTLPLG